MSFVESAGSGGKSSMSTVSIWSEKIDGKGEDGPPLILLSDDHSFGVIAVSDGVGGAGSRQVAIGGEQASGARMAARKLLEVVFAFFKGAWLQDPHNVDTAEALAYITAEKSTGRIRHSEKSWISADVYPASHEHKSTSSPTKASAERGETRRSRAGRYQPAMQLKPYLAARVGDCSAYLLSSAAFGSSISHHIELLGKTIDEAFEKMNRGLGDQSSSRLKTKIQRNLPSTLAGWVYRSAPKKEIAAFWAGDSRCYILSEDGLCQVSRDDAKGDFDAFEAIWSDPPLTNYISERIPNSIKQRCLPCNHKALLICASDGAFNYLSTPMDFEFVILSSLISSGNMQIWADTLGERLQASACDDVSIVLHPLGFDCFDNMKSFYKRRLDELNDRFVEPMVALHEKQAQLEKELASVRAEAKEKTQEEWSQYRVIYEQYIPEGDSG